MAMLTSGQLLDLIPAPLKTEFLAGRWLPIVGAGLSLGARAAGPEGMPDWKALGTQIGADLPSAYTHDGAIETLSAYEHAFGRVQLVNRVSSALQVGSARPGAAQTAFARLPFEYVVTTNVEALLEDAYRQVRGPVVSVIDDAQLRLPNPYGTPTTLVKLHGDLHSPGSLVLTEDDYDNISLRRPLTFTWLANQLITKTGILIGYSLGDQDVRGILSGLRDRLGEAPPDLWVLTVGRRPVEEDRFRRRGVKILSLPDDYGGWDILEPLFDALQELWDDNILGRLSGTTSTIDAALKAGVSLPNVVLFLVPPERLSAYNDNVFPELLRNGLVPVSRADVRAPAGLEVAALDGLLRAAGVVVVEADRLDEPNVTRALRAVGEPRVLLVSDVLPVGPRTLRRVVGARLDSFGRDLTTAILQLDDVPDAAEVENPDARPDSSRSPRARQSEALVALVELEGALRRFASDLNVDSVARSDLGGLLNALKEEDLLPEVEADQVDRLVETRGKLLHGHDGDVPEGDVAWVLTQSQRLLQALAQEAQLASEVGEFPRDAELLLQRFERQHPGGQHRLIARGMASRNFLLQPTPASSSYLRWVGQAQRGRLPVYQNSDALAINAQAYRAFAAGLPGAEARSRSVVFRISSDRVNEVLEVVDRLREYGKAARPHS